MDSDPIVQRINSRYLNVKEKVHDIKYTYDDILRYCTTYLSRYRNNDCMDFINKVHAVLNVYVPYKLSPNNYYMVRSTGILYSESDYKVLGFQHANNSQIKKRAEQVARKMYKHDQHDRVWETGELIDKYTREAGYRAKYNFYLIKAGNNPIHIWIRQSSLGDYYTAIKEIDEINIPEDILKGTYTYHYYLYNKQLNNLRHFYFNFHVNDSDYHNRYRISLYSTLFKAHGIIHIYNLFKRGKLYSYCHNDKLISPLHQDEEFHHDKKIALKLSRLMFYHQYLID